MSHHPIWVYFSARFKVQHGSSLGFSITNAHWQAFLDHRMATEFLEFASIKRLTKSWELLNWLVPMKWMLVVVRPDFLRPYHSQHWEFVVFTAAIVLWQFGCDFNRWHLYVVLLVIGLARDQTTWQRNHSWVAPHESIANRRQSNLSKASLKFVCRTDLKVERKKLYVTWICGESRIFRNFLILNSFG